MNIRDRIKELRRVRGSELRPNPKNWKTHPDRQRDVLRGLLAEIGFAGAVLARELEDGTLQLIDGHLRAETTPGTELPVLVLDVTEAEADKILATFDPLGDLAEPDGNSLDALLAEVTTENEALQSLLEELNRNAADDDNDDATDDGQPDDPIAEWSDMPEFHQSPKGVRTIHVHFAKNEDVDAFAHALGCSITHATRYIWFPAKPSPEAASNDHA